MKLNDGDVNQQAAVNGAQTGSLLQTVRQARPISQKRLHISFCLCLHSQPLPPLKVTEGKLKGISPNIYEWKWGTLRRMLA